MEVRLWDLHVGDCFRYDSTEWYTLIQKYYFKGRKRAVIQDSHGRIYSHFSGSIEVRTITQLAFTCRKTR